MSTSPIDGVAASLRKLALASGEAIATREVAARAHALENLERRLSDLETMATRLEAALEAGQIEKPREAPPSRSATPDELLNSILGITGEEEQAQGLPLHWSLAELCAERGLEVIDRRNVPGGSLWVVGPREVAQPLFQMLAAEGVRFIYAPGGSRSTGRRPGWFTKSQR